MYEDDVHQHLDSAITRPSLNHDDVQSMYVLPIAEIIGGKVCIFKEYGIMVYVFYEDCVFNRVRLCGSNMYIEDKPSIKSLNDSFIEKTQNKRYVLMDKRTFVKVHQT
jgi:hypothetical protein